MKKLVLLFFGVLILFGNGVEESENSKTNLYNEVIQEANKMLFDDCLNKKIGDACDAIGLNYYKGDHGLKQNHKKAFEYFKLACKYGSAEGCNNVGIFYGTGVGNVVKKNIKKAIEYYQKACNKNYKIACKNLGAIYFNRGLHILNKDKFSAYLDFAMACKDFKIAPACYNAGYVAYNYLNIKKDIIKKYFKKSCELGYTRGCEFLRTHF